MTFLRTIVIRSAIVVLLFAYFIELLQFFRLIKWLGLENSRLANIILGSSFSWMDMLLYTLGIIFVIFIEKVRSSRKDRLQ